MVGSLNENNRHEWIRNTLQKIPPNLRILDAGAGEQQYKKYCNHLNYVSQDFAQYEGEGNGKGLQTGTWNLDDLDITCDISSIPEPDGSFDVILCTEVFEHLPDPLQAIKEFSRLLGKGGMLIITAPFNSLTHFAPYHYSSGFNRYFYEYHLPRFGFEIIELTANGNYFEYIAQEMLRISSIAGKYANDKPNLHERWATRIVLSMLDRFSKKGAGSEELLAYGYFVLARKSD